MPALSLSSYLRVNRDVLKDALALPMTIVGTGASTSTITVTGLLATDIVTCVVNLTDPTETQVAVTGVTASANLITADSGTPFANTEKYLVQFLRPVKDGRND